MDFKTEAKPKLYLSFKHEDLRVQFLSDLEMGMYLLL